MRLLRPRSGRLDVFATTLLMSLGCGPNVETPGGDGGAGGSGASGHGASSSNGGGSVEGGASSSGGSSAQGGQGTGGEGTGGGTIGTGGCKDPQPILVDGIDTGLDRCAGGNIRRRAALTCPSSFPDPNECCGGCQDGYLCTSGSEVACTCVPACFSDAECGPDELCMCGDPAGVCVPAGCHGPEECGPEQECTSWDPTEGCLYVEFQCTTPQDTCGGDADCLGINEYCIIQPDGHRECAPGGCAIGRPFLVEGEARTASLVRRSDWCEAGLSPSFVDPQLAAELAEAWEHTARMEHASIAAFARFALQLLALGAPPDLVERTTRAMADETRHAKQALALASAYRGVDVGPGALSIDGSLAGDVTAAEVVRLVLREGCVGETVAALEASFALEHVVDPRVKGVLEGIADDETAHAELAWRTVHWALGAFGEDVASVLEEEIARLEAELRSSAPGRAEPRETLLLAHGVVGEQGRARLRREAIAKAILPCLRALLAEKTRLAA